MKTKMFLCLIAVVLVITSFCSCGKEVECDFCDAKYPEHKGNTSEVFGETVHMCPDCYAEFKDVTAE